MQPVLLGFVSRVMSTHSCFTSFRPKDPTIARYVDYYYLERKLDNVSRTFECFPHYNNAISLYTSHLVPEIGRVVHDENASPLQIFTPVREEVLRVKQTGPVERIVIVFNPLGIQQFWRGLSFTDYRNDYLFFSQDELSQLFGARDIKSLNEYIDALLCRRYQPNNNELVAGILSYIFSHRENFTVAAMADSLRISRRHLHRVFKATIGVSLKRFHEIVVFRGVMDSKLSGEPDASLTQLAYTANFSDQAHMIKVFHRLTRNPPGHFFAKGKKLGGADTFWHEL